MSVILPAFFLIAKIKSSNRTTMLWFYFCSGVAHFFAREANATKIPGFAKPPRNVCEKAGIISCLFIQLTPDSGEAGAYNLTWTCAGLL